MKFSNRKNENFKLNDTIIQFISKDQHFYIKAILLIYCFLFSYTTIFSASLLELTKEGEFRNSLEERHETTLKNTPEDLLALRELGTGKYSFRTSFKSN